MDYEKRYIRIDTYEITDTVTENSFEVDALIAPAITLLNKKGYITAFCCSGHVAGDHYLPVAYIAFLFGGITPETIPEGWCWACDGQMEYRYYGATQEMIKMVMSELIVWAANLPDTTINYEF